LRELIAKYRAPGDAPPAVPEPAPSMSLAPAPMRAYASLWTNLGKPVLSVQPKPMEAYGRDYGLIVYETGLIGRLSGKLTLTELHDYATLFADGKSVGKLDRRGAESTSEPPKTESANPKLTILVEAMGPINFAQHLIDRKGITDRATLNGMTLMNWRAYPLPLRDEWVSGLTEGPAGDSPGSLLQRLVQHRKTGGRLLRHVRLREGDRAGERAQPGAVLGDLPPETAVPSRPVAQGRA
jgi:hypothetical protein